MDTKISPKAWNDGLALDNLLLKAMRRTNPVGVILLQTNFTRAERVHMVRDHFQGILDRAKETTKQAA